MADFFEERLPIGRPYGASYGDEYGVEITTTRSGAEHHAGQSSSRYSYFMVEYTKDGGFLGHGPRLPPPACMQDSGQLGLGTTTRPTAERRPHRHRPAPGPESRPASIRRRRNTAPAPPWPSAAPSAPCVQTGRRVGPRLNQRCDDSLRRLDAGCNHHHRCQRRKAIHQQHHPGRWRGSHGGRSPRPVQSGQSVHFSGVVRAEPRSTTGTRYHRRISRHHPHRRHQLPPPSPPYTSGGTVNLRPPIRRAVKGYYFDLPAHFNSRIDVSTQLRPGVGTIDLIRLLPHRARRQSPPG